LRTETPGIAGVTKHIKHIRRIDMITNKVKIALISGAAAIIIAIIGVVVTNKAAASAIINNHITPAPAPVIPQPTTKDVSIAVRDADTGALISGAVITVTGPDGKLILQNQSAATGRSELSTLEMGEYTVKVSADNYLTDERPYNLHAVPWEVRLNKLPPPPPPPVMTPLPFAGWHPWGGLTASPRSNTVTLGGAFTDAGYLGEDIRGLGGKKLILEIAGTANSTFHDGQLFKLETADKVHLTPEEVLSITGGGFIPAFDGRVTFAIPGDFRGRLNLVFYRAELRDLRISAFYE
jgi:hypothetical protein